MDEVECKTMAVRLESLRSLGQWDYDVHKSSSVERFLQANLQRRPELGVYRPTASKIIERLGKISKIHLAALKVDRFINTTDGLDRQIAVKLVPTAPIPVLELAGAIAAQAHVRAGQRSHAVEGNRLIQMLGRRPNYRQDAEIQLTVSYEENSQ